jgi:hypothetical protein
MRPKHLVRPLIARPGARVGRVGIERRCRLARELVLALEHLGVALNLAFLPHQGQPTHTISPRWS